MTNKKKPFDPINLLIFLPALAIVLIVGMLLGSEHLDADLEVRRIEQLRTEVNRLCPLPEGVAVKVIETNSHLLFKQDRNSGWLEFLISDKVANVPLIEMRNCEALNK